MTERVFGGLNLDLHTASQFLFSLECRSKNIPFDSLNRYSRISGRQPSQVPLSKEVWCARTGDGILLWT